MLLLLVPLDDFFANLALCGVAVALNSVGSCLASRDQLFAIGALDIFLALLRGHKLLLSAENFRIAFGFHIKNLDIIN